MSITQVLYRSEMELHNQRNELIENIWKLPRKAINSSGVLLLIRLALNINKQYMTTESLKSLSLAVKLCPDAVVTNLNRLDKERFIFRTKGNSNKLIPTTYEINVERINQIIERINQITD